MAAAFECPNCGAPLDFEPEPGDDTVVCSFCDQEVPIPLELRIPLPEPVDAQPVVSTSSKQPNWLLIAVILFLVFAAAKSMWNSAFEYLWASGSIGTHPDAQATAQANELLVKQEQAWPVSMSDAFLDNSNAWPTGDLQDDEFLTGSRSIANGAYTWNVSAVKDAINMAFPELPVQRDFFASVDIKFIQMPADKLDDVGLILRYNKAGPSFYYYSLNDKGQYFFGWHDKSGWTNTIPETSTGAFRAGKTNRLAVGVNGGKFTLLLNDQVIDHVSAFDAESGQVGVGLNLSNPDDTASFAFTNFKVFTSTTTPLK